MANRFGATHMKGVLEKLAFFAIDVPLLGPLLVAAAGLYWIGWPAGVWLVAGALGTLVHVRHCDRSFLREEWMALQWMPLTGIFAWVIVGAAYARRQQK